MAVCTSRPETAQESAKYYGANLAFHDYNAMVNHPGIDLVTVCVRAPFHHRMVMAALEAGKHVFCEWPLGVNLAEAEEMASLAESKGVPFNVAQIYRRLSEAIRGKGDAQPDFNLALKRHRLLDAIERSADQGVAVRVS